MDSVLGGAVLQLPLYSVLVYPVTGLSAKGSIGDEPDNVLASCALYPIVTLKQNSKIENFFLFNNFIFLDSKFVNQHNSAGAMHAFLNTEEEL